MEAILIVLLLALAIGIVAERMSDVYFFSFCRYQVRHSDEGLYVRVRMFGIWTPVVEKLDRYYGCECL